ncbi:S-adenosylmethionine decarboxylase [Oxalobacteraceae bacterium GrIS 2.11]
MKPAAFEPSGRHLLADLYGILPDKLDDPATVQQLLQDSALLAGACILSSHFHSFGSGQGVTGVVLLAESHISIHTWPEYGFAAVDIFMCGAAQPERALALLQRTFAATGSTIKTISRGLAHTGLEKKTG